MMYVRINTFKPWIKNKHKAAIAVVFITKNINLTIKHKMIWLERICTKYTDMFNYVSIESTTHITTLIVDGHTFEDL